MNLLQRLLRGSRERTFARFADNACEATASITIAIKDLKSLISALERSIIAQTVLSGARAFDTAVAGLSLRCSTCGDLSEAARAVAILGAEGGALQTAPTASFEGPNVEVLLKGQCPGCGTTTITATFDPRVAQVGWPEQHKYHDELVDAAKRCLIKATARLVGRHDVRALSEGARLKVQCDIAREMLLEQYPRLLRKDAASYVDKGFAKFGQDIRKSQSHA